MCVRSWTPGRERAEYGTRKHWKDNAADVSVGEHCYSLSRSFSVSTTSSNGSGEGDSSWHGTAALWAAGCPSWWLLQAPGMHQQICMLEKAEQLERRHKDLRGKISLARLENDKAFVWIWTCLIITLTRLKIIGPTVFISDIRWSPAGDRQKLHLMVIYCAIRCIVWVFYLPVKHLVWATVRDRMSD